MDRPERTETAAAPRPRRRPRKEAASTVTRSGRRARMKSAPDTAAPKATPRKVSGEAARPRKALVSGSALLLVGLAMVGVDSSDAGAVVTLLGLLLLIYGIHSFGRLGPDEPLLAARADD